MSDLITSLANTIFQESCDIVQEYTEITIDTVLDNDILKQIPLISTAVGIGKIAIAIRDRNYLKNTIIFIKKLRENTINKDQLMKHREKLDKNPKQREKEIGLVLLYLDEFKNDMKSRIFANIYTAFLNEMFEWEDFIILTEILDDISVVDISLLQNLYDKKQFYEGDSYIPFSLKRLDSIGVIRYFNGAGMLMKEQPGKKVKATIEHAGEVFVEVGLQGIVIEEI